jgi:hypothetical protein
VCQALLAYMGRLGLVHHRVYDVGEQIVGIAKIYLQQGELENVGYCFPPQPVRHANAQIACSQEQGNLLDEKIRKSK